MFARLSLGAVSKSISDVTFLEVFWLRYDRAIMPRLDIWLRWFYRYGRCGYAAFCEAQYLSYPAIKLVAHCSCEDWVNWGQGRDLRFQIFHKKQPYRPKNIFTGILTVKYNTVILTVSE